VHDYIHYYNHERIKLGLQGLSPVEYRLKNTA
jgi:putative transposase